jgi:signal transduction histidine kinase
METAINRITAISGNLRTFCRSDHCGKTAVDLHDCLETALLLLKYRSKATETRPKIRVTCEYGTLPNVSCFPGQLSQVFTNLLANAIDMFDEAFERADVPLTEPKLHIQTTLVGDTVCISIDDNGLGMEEAVQARIFEPLYTTKGAGKGTGLGLAISRQIVEESHGGHLRVRSTPGVGTGFTIELPRTDR